MMPSPSDLHYFVEVASTLNISRAAERLGISQPSLSLSIQRLEHTVGASLLMRNKKGVTLTQSGKQLLLHTKDLVQRWESVKSQTLAARDEIQGSYTLGCHASVALYALSGFMSDLLEKNPKLEIKLLHDLSRKIAEQVIQMEIDVGIVVNPIKHPDLVIRKLCDDEVTLWVGKGDRKTQDFQSGHAVLICDPDLLQTQDLVRRLKKHGILYERIMASSSLEVITDLTASGVGIGVIPEKVAAKAFHAGLRRVPHAPIFLDEICLLYRMENKNVRSVQAIVEQVVASFDKKFL